MGFTLLGILSSAGAGGGVTVPAAGYMLFSSGVKLDYATETIIGVSITDNNQFFSNFSSQTHGYIVGAYDTKYSFQTEASTSLVGAAGEFGASTESSSSGYSVGQGSPDSLKKRAFSTDVRTVLSGFFSPIDPREGGASASTVKAYFFGGLGTGVPNDIRSVTFSSDTLTLLAATLSVDRSFNVSIESDTSSYIAGGGTNTVDKLAFSTETRTTLASSLPNAGFSPAGLASRTNGYYAGGALDIYKINFATDTVSTLAATLATTQSSMRSHFTWKGP